jgi:kynurenine formamidase
VELRPAVRAWAADYHKHGREPRYLSPCHLLGLKKEYAHIEQLANLDQLPPHGFKVIALPLRIADGSAGLSEPSPSSKTEADGRF